MQRGSTMRSGTSPVWLGRLLAAARPKAHMCVLLTLQPCNFNTCTRHALRDAHAKTDERQ